MNPDSRPRPASLLFITVLLGLAVSGADQYFGNGNGKTGAFLLGVLMFGGLAFEFLTATHSLRHPRALDMDFVLGADYARRRAAAMRQLRSALLRQSWVPLAALCTAGVVLRLSALKMAGIAAVLAMESLAVSLAMIGAVRFGWIPISRKKFHAREVRPSDSFGAAAASMLIRRSAAAARLLTGWIPGPDRWVLRRKLLYLIRTDPVSLLIFLSLATALAIQFNITWGFNLSAVFTLVTLLLAVTSLQTAFREPDAYYGHNAYFLPPRRIDYRATLSLFLAVAAVLLAQFVFGCIVHMGWREALSYRAFWHVLATGAALPFLFALDPPRVAEMLGEKGDLNTRVLLNFCYLGLAAWLFMFSWPGVALTGVVLVMASLLCFRIAADRKPLPR